MVMLFDTDQVLQQQARFRISRGVNDRPPPFTQQYGEHSPVEEEEHGQNADVGGDAEDEVLPTRKNRSSRSMVIYAYP